MGSGVCPGTRQGLAPGQELLEALADISDTSGPVLSKLWKGQSLASAEAVRVNLCTGSPVGSPKLLGMLLYLLLGHPL